MNEPTKEPSTFDGWQSFTANTGEKTSFVLEYVLDGIANVFIQKKKKLILVHSELVNISDCENGKIRVKFEVVKGQKYFVHVRNLTDGEKFHLSNSAWSIKEFKDSSLARSIKEFIDNGWLET